MASEPKKSRPKDEKHSRAMTRLLIKNLDQLRETVARDAKELKQV